MTTGTWIPVISCHTPGTLNLGYSGGIQTGLWDLDANGIVTVHFTLYPTTFDRGTASGEIFILGLPYAVGQSINSIGPLNYRGINKTGFTQFNVSTRLASGTDRLVLRCNAQGTSDGLVAIDDLASGNGSMDFCGNVRYVAGAYLL